jgi:arabinogalactan endo-1,4-beta-galactosidase
MNRRIVGNRFAPAVRGIAWTLVLVTMVATHAFAAKPSEPDYAIGADLSFLPLAESRGAVFRDAGTARPGLQIFRAHGYNWIRLRLFHTPTDLPNTLAYTIATAQAARALGYKFLLDIHYSDTWADPQKQFTPAAWRDLPHPQLVQAVREYTRDTLKAFQAAGVPPAMVQIGNEVTPGMLWPDGQLPEHWDNFADLLKAGIAGVGDACGDGPRPRIMIHIERSGDRAAAQGFYEELERRGVAFDVIGLSYYPWWHGSLLNLRDTLAALAQRFHKDLIVVEAAYNWRPAEYKGKPAPFPESPEGQREFLDEVNRVVLAVPGGYGKGVFWWEPAVMGPLRSRGFFDDRGEALPVLTVFDRFTRY